MKYKSSSKRERASLAAIELYRLLSADWEWLIKRRWKKYDLGMEKLGFKVVVKVCNVTAIFNGFRAVTITRFGKSESKRKVDKKRKKEKRRPPHVTLPLWLLCVSLNINCLFVSLFSHNRVLFFVFIFHYRVLRFTKKNLGHTNSHAYLSLICNLFTFQVEYLSSYIIFPFFFVFWLNILLSYL